jgi:hypothetical protein
MTETQEQERLDMIKNIVEKNACKDKNTVFTPTSLKLRLSAVLSAMKNGYQL